MPITKKFLTQLEMNQLATNRLITEMQDWDDFDDVFNPLNEALNLNIQTLDELKLTPTKSNEVQYSEVLEIILNNIASQDGFGTEQQCDPRGDFRNHEWSMWNVEP